MNLKKISDIGLFALCTVGISFTILMLTKECTKPYRVHIFKTDTIRTRELHFDTVWREVQNTVTLIDSYLVEVPAVVDTQSIIREYFKKRIYTDTLNDDTLELIISDTISFNKLQGRFLKYRILTPTIINKTEIVNNYLEDRHSFYGGFQAAHGTIAPSVVYSNTRYQVNASYDVIQSRVIIGAHWKLFSKKK